MWRFEKLYICISQTIYWAFQKNLKIKDFIIKKKKSYDGVPI